MLRTKLVVKPTCIFDFETGLNNTKTLRNPPNRGKPSALATSEKAYGRTRLTEH